MMALVNWSIKCVLMMLEAVIWIHASKLPDINTYQGISAKDILIIEWAGINFVIYFRTLGSLSCVSFAQALRWTGVEYDSTNRFDSNTSVPWRLRYLISCLIMIIIEMWMWSLCHNVLVKRIQYRLTAFGDSIMCHVTSMSIVLLR